MDKVKPESIEITSKIRRTRCRLCKEFCEPNKLLWNRDFREKLQDILCTWIKILPGTEKYHVCDSCRDQVEEFYAFKRLSRGILHGENYAVVPLNETEEVSSGLESLLQNCTNEVTLPPETLDELTKAIVDEQSPVNVYPNGDDLNRRPPEDQSAETKGDTLPTDLASYLSGDHQPEQEDCASNAQSGLIKKKRPYRRKYKRTDEELAMPEAVYKKYYSRRYNAQSKKVCDICGKSVNPQRMDSHMNRHNGIQPYTCEECGLQFHCRMNMRKHITRSHAKDDEVTCDICGKVSSSQIAHKQHLRTVHREKKFQCTLCGVKAHTKGALDGHMDIHNQRRDFVCPHCGKAFYRRYVLNIHLRTHSGECPYKCHVCFEAFVHRRIYVMHMQKHHPGEPLMKIDGLKALKESLMKKDFV